MSGLLTGALAAAAWRWPHFSIAEMTSRGGAGGLKVDPDFMDRLERLRDAFGRPMPVSSGYRTPEYNQRVSSTGPNGPHTTGRAVDVAVRGEAAFALIRLAMALGFTGIGVAQKGNSRFVHLDDLPNGAHPRPCIWSY